MIKAGVLLFTVSMIATAAMPTGAAFACPSWLCETVPAPGSRAHDHRKKPSEGVVRDHGSKPPDRPGGILRDHRAKPSAIVRDHRPTAARRR
jgi:hypothetical protein